MGCFTFERLAQNSLEASSKRHYKDPEKTLENSGAFSCMPFQLLDIILIGVMLVSGILALLRGFTREVLSMVAWGLAALAAYFAIQQPQALAFAQKYVEKDILAQIAVGATAFIVVLIIVSIISVKLSDAVVDSAAGAVDRTLGFLFGLGRGLVLVAVAYLFYGWLVPPDRQDDWVKNAQTLPLVKSTSNIILALVPPNMVEALSNTALSNSGESQPGTDAPSPTDQQGVTNGDSQSLGTLSKDATGAQVPAQ
jgi:membrane protein required for colicin V production